MMVDRPLVVLQPTSLCNIDCDYCYLPNRHRDRSMSLATVARIAQEVFQAPWTTGEVTFLWHLGEPLVRGLAFYGEAFALIAAAASESGRSFRHSFQTNAVLLDEPWAAWLGRHRVQVGVSLDGPEFLHDAHRRTRRGAGTHARAVQGTRHLLSAGVDVGAICVLTSQALDHPDEVVAFFLDLGVPELAFNIDEIEGVYRATSHAGGEGSQRYRAFLGRVLALLAAAPGRIHLREAWTYLPRILFGVPPYNLASEPLRVLTFDHAGNVSTFAPELSAAAGASGSRFALGNVHDGIVGSLPAHPVQQALAAEVAAGLSRCSRTCAYWRCCGGGDPSSKYFEHGHFDVAETQTCRIHVQGSVDAALDYLQQAADGRVPLDETLWRATHVERT